MDSLNPHCYIDGKANYVVIMTLKNVNEEGKPYVLAMYSERPLKPKDEINNGNGFIASVTNRKAFYLTKSTQMSPRVTEYHEWYIVYGKG